MRPCPSAFVAQFTVNQVDTYKLYGVLRMEYILPQAVGMVLIMPWHTYNRKPYVSIAGFQVDI